MKGEILNGKYVFSDRKHVVMKPWDSVTGFKREDVCTIPIWIRLEKLDLKYWGEKALFKIVGQIGKPLMMDKATRLREKLYFPRVLIEVSIKHDLPDWVQFGDELDRIVKMMNL